MRKTYTREPVWVQRVCDGQRVALCNATRWPMIWEEDGVRSASSICLLSSKRILKTVYQEFSQSIIAMAMTRSWINSSNET